MHRGLVNKRWKKSPRETGGMWTQFFSSVSTCCRGIVHDYLPNARLSQREKVLKEKELGQMSTCGAIYNYFSKSIYICRFL
jgi:hypothetical protein